MENYRSDLKPLARRLRSQQTDAEQSLWQALKHKQLGVPFYRQKPLLSYIVDFYCPAAKLVIELDGTQHASHAGLIADQQRDAALQALGLSVLRFDDRQVLLEREAVLSVIKAFIDQACADVSGSAEIPPNPPFTKGGTDSPQVAIPIDSALDSQNSVVSADIQPQLEATTIPPFEKGGRGGISASFQLTDKPD